MAQSVKVGNECNNTSNSKIYTSYCKTKTHEDSVPSGCDNVSMCSRIQTFPDGVLSCSIVEIIREGGNLQ